TESQWELTSIFYILFAGVIASALAFVMWSYILKHTEASKASTFILLFPIVGVISGVIFLDETDRKSTRLNSSHDSILYAVFCLNAAITILRIFFSLHDALPIYRVAVGAYIYFLYIIRRSDCFRIGFRDVELYIETYRGK